VHLLNVWEEQNFTLLAILQFLVKTKGIFDIHFCFIVEMGVVQMQGRLLGLVMTQEPNYFLLCLLNVFFKYL